MCFTSANLYKSFFPEKARSSRFAIASVGLVAKPVRSREPQRGSLLAALVATEKWTLPALSSHRDLRNPAARSHAVNFCRHNLNLLRVHWSAKHGPGIRKAHSPTAAHPGQRSQKNCVHEPLDTRFRSAARLLQPLWREDRACRSAPMSTRMASAANSGNSSPPRSPIPPGARLPYREVAALVDAERWRQTSCRACRSPSICSRPRGTLPNARRAI